MYAHHTVLPINNLHLQIDLPAEFANYTEAEIIIFPILKPAQIHQKSLKINQLNHFFAQLPKLGEETDTFATDLKAIRQSIPVETNPWD